jgi:SAM-dependent methyltransferase
MAAVISAENEFVRRDQETMADAVNYSRWILNELVLPHVGSDVLEIGSGIGSYSAAIATHPAVKRLTCIELDPLCVAEARARFAEPIASGTVELVHGDYMEVALHDQAFDTVVCLNVLEHIEHDGQALAKAYAALKPGGRLVLYVPAFPSIMGEIDRRLGHFRRYTKASMRDLLKDAGFGVRQLRYYNLTGFVGWLVRFRVLKRSEQSPGVVGLFDRTVMPWQARLEAHWPWQPIGQSLYVVAEKP